MKKVYTFLSSDGEGDLIHHWSTMYGPPDLDMQLLIKQFKRAMYEPIGGEVKTIKLGNYRYWSVPTSLSIEQVGIATSLEIPIVQTFTGDWRVHDDDTEWVNRFLLWLCEEHGFECIGPHDLEEVNIDSL